MHQLLYSHLLIPHQVLRKAQGPLRRWRHEPVVVEGRSLISRQSGQCLHSEWPPPLVCVTGSLQALLDPTVIKLNCGMHLHSINKYEGETTSQYHTPRARKCHYSITTHSP